LEKSQPKKKKKRKREVNVPGGPSTSHSSFTGEEGLNREEATQKTKELNTAGGGGVPTIDTLKKEKRLARTATAWVERNTSEERERTNERKKREYQKEDMEKKSPTEGSSE